MAEPIIPEGFVLDNQNTQSQQQSAVPEGFVLDEPQQSGNVQNNVDTKPKMSASQAVFTTATNPLGFGDEIKAGIAAGVAKLFGGAATQNIDIGELYREARNTERTKLERARQEQPIASFVGQMFSDIGATGKLFKASQGIGGAIKTGSAIGGATGLGETQDIKDAPQVLKDVATGATVGGAVSGIASPAISLIGNAAKGVKNLFKAKSAEDILAARLPKEQTAQLLEQLKTATPENPVLLPDIAGDSIKGLTRAVAKMPAAKDIVTDALENRSQEAVSRVSNILAKDVSAVDSYFSNLDDISKARSEMSKPLYDKVFGKTTLNTQKKEELWKQAVGDSGITTPEELQNTVKNYAEARKTLKNNKETSLLQFIRSKGGIADFKGELKSLGITNKTLPGLLRKEGTKGVGIDDIGEKLMEAGYFTERPSTSEVLDLIDKELRGNKTNLNPEVENAKRFIQEFDRAGIDLKAISDWQTYKPEIKSTGATLQIKGNEELFSKIAPELKTVRKDFRLSPEEAPDNSFTLLHHVKESLFDKAQVLKRQGANAQARVYDNLRTELTKKMGEVSPDYKKANEIFGGFSQLKTAQEKGLEFSKLRPEEIKREMLSMSVGERDAYRIGVRENLQKVVSSTADGSDPAKRIFGNEFKREQLKAVFGNETKFKEFEEKLATEIRAADTKAKVLGGSRTDYNMAGDDEFLNKMIEGGFTVAKSKLNPLYLLEATYNAISNKFAGINNKNAKEVAKALIDRNQTVKVLDNIIAREKNPIQKRAISEAKNFIASSALARSSVQANNEQINNENNY